MSNLIAFLILVIPPLMVIAYALGLKAADDTPIRNKEERDDWGVF
jgi:hypothetical protein